MNLRTLGTWRATVAVAGAGRLFPNDVGTRLASMAACGNANGVEGQPTQRLGYRILGTYQKGWGTYSNPFTKKHHNVSFLVEGHYDFPHQWQLKAGYAMDFGSEKMLGHNAGMQITISKRGLLKQCLMRLSCCTLRT